MKKGKIVLVAICLMVILSITNLSAYGIIYKKLEPEVNNIYDNKQKRKEEEKERKTTIYIAIGVSVVSFVVFIGTTCALVKAKKEQKK